MNTQSKLEKRVRKHKKIRAKVSGTASRPRLSVFKSNMFVYAQAINDDAGKTLVSVHGKDAAEVGGKVAKNLLSQKISKVVFDRGGYVYTGKVAALAQAAREAGLEF